MTSTSATSGCAAAKRDSGRDASRRGRDVERRAAAGAGEQRRARERRISSSAAVLVDRCERDGRVAEELGVDPARADDDERPEARVAPRADEQLEPGRHVLQRLDGERLRRQPRGDRRSRRSSSLVVEAEHDAARVRLVQAPERLQHDRVAELRRGRERLVAASPTMRAAPNGTPAAASAARAAAYPRPVSGVAGGRERRQRGGTGTPSATSAATASTADSIAR